MVRHNTKLDVTTFLKFNELILADEDTQSHIDAKYAKYADYAESAKKYVENAYMAPLPRICVCLCKYTYELVEKKLDFSKL